MLEHLRTCFALPQKMGARWPMTNSSFLAASSQMRGRPSRSLPIQVPTTIDTCVFLEGAMANALQDTLGRQLVQTRAGSEVRPPAPPRPAPPSAPCHAHAHATPSHPHHPIHPMQCHCYCCCCYCCSLLLLPAAAAPCSLLAAAARCSLLAARCCCCFCCCFSLRSLLFLAARCCFSLLAARCCCYCYYCCRSHPI